MDFSMIIRHMNENHEADMVGLCKKFGAVSEVHSVAMKGVDFAGIDLIYNGKEELRIEFPQAATMETIKQAIIDLCMSVPKTLEFEEVKKEIEGFKKEFGSITLATIDNHGHPMASYAPLIQLNGHYYIYISATAEHYENIKNHPQKIEVMFLEDESKAKSVILRKRLRYKAHAKFIERGSAEFEHALDHLEKSMGGTGGVKTIRNFADFHLIELQLKSGRFVKGFGQAYLISDHGEVAHIGISGNPHGTIPHGHGGNPHGHGSHPHGHPHGK
ncbi:HugZ family heme oxygenase [Helicobacter mustelae]|uniref:Heme oxygenase n=1 Tax=Helicobacter mustelae (strain ATCC 43772 / CCUG 25715 / CIP 103759 / LMG 18044 / NCTC 12198 / R85-136P) TaxID=679897 RepID=D3UGQ9_HELM1|nr:HugZ family heme oxygenase [Helicobacter mustelae]CBG39680.1 Heme oxygenase [Helicobacter mustelae 12198]SQH71185.1 heme oxygenase [Helicobacter mustelae]STP12312.1 heme oxygenase [Helicobacter mustelae]